MAGVYVHTLDGGYQSKKGFAKIRMTCKMAAEAGISYAWVDTCCI